MATAPCTCKPDDGSGRCPREQECYENWLGAHPQRIQRHPATHFESGPQSEAQWLDEAGAGMSDEEVTAWIETL